jgi:hypothetical protein
MTLNAKCKKDLGDLFIAFFTLHPGAAAWKK